MHRTIQHIKSFIQALAVIGICIQGLNAQRDTLLLFFQKQEIRLKELTNYAFRSKNEQQRIDSNKVFMDIFKQVLSYSASFDYPFDSLMQDVSILSNKNKTFRIITWNLPKNDGTHLYFGFIQQWWKKKGEKTPEYRLYELHDVSASIKSNPETYTGTHEKWFGMLYYQIIENADYWILLGWDGNEKLVQRKFIDVLYFKKDGTPIFGKDVFKLPKKNPRRIMFQYSSEVTMVLRYEKKKDAIVFNHLSPETEDPYMKDQYQFYGPDGSFDALVKTKSKWRFVEDVDVRNPDANYSETKKPNPKKQKPLYTPK